MERNHRRNLEWIASNLDFFGISDEQVVMIEPVLRYHKLMHDKAVPDLYVITEKDEHFVFEYKNSDRHLYHGMRQLVRAKILASNIFGIVPSCVFVYSDAHHFFSWNANRKGYKYTNKKLYQHARQRG